MPLPPPRKRRILERHANEEFSLPSTHASLMLVFTFIGFGLMGQSCSGSEPSGIPSPDSYEDTEGIAGDETVAAADTPDSETNEQPEPQPEPCDDLAPGMDADPSCTEVCGRIDECFRQTSPNSNAEVIDQCIARCLSNRRCSHAHGCSPEFDAVAMCFMEQPLDAICDGVGLGVGGCDEKLSILGACGGAFI